MMGRGRRDHRAFHPLPALPRKGGGFPARTSGVFLVQKVKAKPPHFTSDKYLSEKPFCTASILA